MKGLPDAIFVIDTGYQKGTLVEAENWASLLSP